MCCAVLCCIVRCREVLCCAVYVLCYTVLCYAVLFCTVLCRAVLCCIVRCGAVRCCAVLCCSVLCSVRAVLCCIVPKALLPEGNGRDVHPRVQVNGRAVCLSARCVLGCCCTAGPVHSRTWPVLLCRRLCTVTQGVCAAPHHQYFVCGAALLGAVHRTALCVPCCTALVGSGNGQWNSCNALPHCLESVGSATLAMHCLTACGQWAMELLLCA